MRSYWTGMAGQANLRGKKEMVLSCHCCSVLDLKRPYLEHLADIEAQQEVDELFAIKSLEK